MQRHEILADYEIYKTQTCRTKAKQILAKKYDCCRSTIGRIVGDTYTVAELDEAEKHRKDKKDRILKEVNRLIDSGISKTQSMLQVAKKNEVGLTYVINIVYKKAQ